MRPLPARVRHANRYSTFFRGLTTLSTEELVATVDILAERYGWSERDTLVIPLRRRKAYVEKVIEKYEKERESVARAKAKRK